MTKTTEKSIPSATVASTPPKPVKFIHEKAAQYRVFHADSAWGSINQWGNVQLDFCVERPAAPSFVVQPVKPDSSFTCERIMHGEEDPTYFLVVRDFQCGVVLSYASAVQVHALLDNYIKTTKQQMDGLIEKIQKK